VKKLAEQLYDGTSAYKLDQYENYTRQAQEKQNNRKIIKEKKDIITRKKLAVIMSVVFVTAIAFLFANALLLQSASKVTELNKELEDMKVRNTQVSFEIVSGVDYNEVERKAISEFGMQHPESYQNVYVNVVQSDYVEMAGKQEEKTGFVEGIISGVQSFLAYIR
jgi:cell division protein FtsL